MGLRIERERERDRIYDHRDHIIMIGALYNIHSNFFFFSFIHSYLYSNFLGRIRNLSLYIYIYMYLLLRSTPTSLY